jgi:hypothetical protein
MVKKQCHLAPSRRDAQALRFLLVSFLRNLSIAFADEFIARGTSEPGPFGVIVGDPLIRNVVAAIPSARGYAVQVYFDSSSKATAINAT